MQWLAMGFFSLLFLASAQAIKLLGSESPLQDAREVAYRFETLDWMVTRLVDRDEIRRIAMDWAQGFYNGDLDQVGVRSRITPIRYCLASLTGTSDHQFVCAVVLTDGSIVEPVEVYTVPDSDLSKLAHLRFTKFGSDDERRAFEKLIQEIEYGEKADFAPGTKSVTDALDLRADSWCTDRIIKAEWIAWLCTDPKASQLVTSHGIRAKWSTRRRGPQLSLGENSISPASDCMCLYGGPPSESIEPSQSRASDHRNKGVAR